MFIFSNSCWGKRQDGWGAGEGGQWYIIILYEVQDIAYNNWLLGLLFEDRFIVNVALLTTVSAICSRCQRCCSNNCLRVGWRVG